MMIKYSIYIKCMQNPANILINSSKYISEPNSKILSNTIHRHLPSDCQFPKWKMSNHDHIFIICQQYPLYWLQSSVSHLYGHRHQLILHLLIPIYAIVFRNFMKGGWFIRWRSTELPPGLRLLTCIIFRQFGN